MVAKFDSSELTFGADPEVFASHTGTDGLEYVDPPAYFRYELGVEFKPDEKHPVFIEDHNIIVMEDGAAFEYTLPPSKDASGLFGEIQTANSMLLDWLARYNYNLTIKPIINYEVERFISKPDEYALCLIFGCDRDEDAIEDDYICHTIDAMLHPLRYGGGHFHIGSFNSEIGELLNKYHRPFIRLLACLVGTASIKNTPYPELETQRALTYGRPGRFRHQKWGIEYRTPSNSWINKQTTLEEMVEGAKKAFELLQNPERGKKLLEDNLDDAITAIRTADMELARKVYNQSFSY